MRAASHSLHGMQGQFTEICRVTHVVALYYSPGPDQYLRPDPTCRLLAEAFTSSRGKRKQEQWAVFQNIVTVWQCKSAEGRLAANLTVYDLDLYGIAE